MLDVADGEGRRFGAESDCDEDWDVCSVSVLSEGDVVAVTAMASEQYTTVNSRLQMA